MCAGDGPQILEKGGVKRHNPKYRQHLEAGKGKKMFFLQ
jgi:hypothetical protein